MGLEAAARAVNVRDVMISRFESLPTTATLDEAAQALLRTTQHEFPIIDGGGRLRGVLTREGLVAGLQQRGGQTPVIEAMAANIPVVRDHEKLIKALEPLKGSSTFALSGCVIYLVMNSNADAKIRALAWGFVLRRLSSWGSRAASRRRPDGSEKSTDGSDSRASHCPGLSLLHVTTA
ncbi:hypothetical protein ABID26_006482 [Mesorhizobium shonense]|uniref:CBS domain-containing protein n=1 Tax=Mesorhizobium shonense TaxID=1209948 RepID=A0ABV2I2H1_9HYPH